jgi:hypothetical protein
MEVIKCDICGGIFDPRYDTLCRISIKAMKRTYTPFLDDAKPKKVKQYSKRIDDICVGCYNKILPIITEIVKKFKV